MYETSIQYWIKTGRPEWRPLNGVVLSSTGEIVFSHSQLTEQEAEKLVIAFTTVHHCLRLKPTVLDHFLQV